MLPLRKLTKGLLSASVGLSVFVGSFYLDRDVDVVKAADAPTVTPGVSNHNLSFDRNPSTRTEVMTYSPTMPSAPVESVDLAKSGSFIYKTTVNKYKILTTIVYKSSYNKASEVTHSAEFSMVAKNELILVQSEQTDERLINSTKSFYELDLIRSSLTSPLKIAEVFQARDYVYVPQAIRFKAFDTSLNPRINSYTVSWDKKTDKLNYTVNASSTFAITYDSYLSSAPLGTRLKTSSGSFDTTGLPTGTYNLRTTADDGSDASTLVYPFDIERNADPTAIQKDFPDTLRNEVINSSLTATDTDVTDTLTYKISVGSTKGGTEYNSSLSIPVTSTLPSNPSTLNYSIDTSKIPFSSLSWNEAKKQFEQKVYFTAVVTDSNGGTTTVEKSFMVTETKPNLNLVTPNPQSYRAYESIKIEGDVLKDNKNTLVTVSFSLAEDTNKDGVADKPVVALTDKLLKSYTSTGISENYGTMHEITLEDIIPASHKSGQYVLTVWAEDANGLKSAVKTTLLDLTLNAEPKITFDTSTINGKSYYSDKEAPANTLPLNNISIVDADKNQTIKLYLSYLDKSGTRIEKLLNTYNTGTGAVKVLNVPTVVTADFFEGENLMKLYAVDSLTGTSNEVSFTPKTLIKPPAVTATPDHADKQAEAIKVTLGFADNESGMGEGSIKSFLITKFKTAPDSNSTWGDVSAKAEPLTDGSYRLNIEDEGNNYLHIKAVDVGGYEKIYTFGPYVVADDKTAPDLFFTLEDGKETVPTSRKDLKVDITVDDDTKPLTNIKLSVSTDMKNWLPSEGFSPSTEGKAIFQVPIPTGTKKGTPVTVFVRAVDEFGNKTIENKSILYGVTPPTGGGGNSEPELGAEIQFGKSIWVHIGGMKFIRKEPLTGTRNFSSGSNKFNPSETGNIGNYLNTTFLADLESELTASDKSFMVDNNWNIAEEDGDAKTVKSRVGLITSSNYKEMDGVFKVQRDAWTLTPSGTQLHMAKASENDTNIVNATASYATHPVIKFMTGLVVDDGKINYPAIDRVIIDKIDALDAKLFGVKRIYPYNRLTSGKTKKSVLMIETAEGMALHVDAGPIGTNLSGGKITLDAGSDGTVFTVDLKGYTYNTLPQKITVKAYKDLDGNGILSSAEYGDGKGYLAVGHIYKDEYYFEVADIE